ncbi:MAG: hypothetical protein O3B43_06755, partial [Chloroflexi bacterium]|nr:hypothetical protein [Chloroflexota bacterium]
MNRERLQNFLRSIPTHTVIILMVVIWLIPTLGLLVTSFRPVQDANTTGWWAVFSERAGGEEYTEFCAACHGPDGNLLVGVPLTDSGYITGFRRSSQIGITFDNEYNRQIHLTEADRPDAQQLANILSYLRRESGLDQRPILTLNNYVDSLVGYRGTASYSQDCETDSVSSDL